MAKARKGQFKKGGGRVGGGAAKKKAPAKRRRRRNPSAPQAVVMNPHAAGHVRRSPRRRAKRRKNPENPAPRRKRRKKHTRKNPEMGTFAKVALGIGGAAAGLGIGTVASSAIEAKSTLSPGWNGAIEVVGGMVIGGALAFLYAPLGIALGVASAGPALVRAGQSLFGVTPAAPGIGTPVLPAAPAPRQLAGFGALEMDIGVIKNDDEMMRLARAAATPLR